MEGYVDQRYPAAVAHLGLMPRENRADVQQGNRSAALRAGPLAEDDRAVGAGEGTVEGRVVGAWLGCGEDGIAVSFGHFSSGAIEMTASVDSSEMATETAFRRASITTFAGSMIPASIMLTGRISSGLSIALRMSYP